MPVFGILYISPIIIGLLVVSIKIDSNSPSWNIERSSRTVYGMSQRMYMHTPPPFNNL